MLNKNTTFSSSHNFLSRTSGKSHHPINLTRAFHFQISSPPNVVNLTACLPLSTKLFLLAISGAPDKATTPVWPCYICSTSFLNVLLFSSMAPTNSHPLTDAQKDSDLGLFPFHSLFSKALSAVWQLTEAPE